MLLRGGEPGADDRRDFIETGHPRSLKAAVPGQKDMALVDQHRNGETKRLDAGGYLSDLLLGMCAGVARVRRDLRERERSDRMRFQTLNVSRASGSYLAWTRVVNRYFANQLRTLYFSGV